MAVRFTAESQGYSTTANVPNGAFTVTWWAYLSVDRGIYSTMWEPGATTGDALYAQVGMDSSRTLITALSEGDDPDTGFTLAVGQWYCFALTQTAAGGDLELHWGTTPGALSSAAGTANTTAAGTLRIGRSVWSNEWWNGRIAAFKQWSAVLSDAEIATELGQYAHVRTANFVRSFWFKTPQTTPTAGTGDLTGGTGATTEAGPDIPDSSATNHTRTLTDPLGATDTATRAQAAARAQVDTLTLADTATPAVVVGAPVVGAGADVAGHVVDTALALTPTEVGTDITERRWTIVAGPAGVGDVLAEEILGAPLVGMYAGYGGHAAITSWADANEVEVTLGHEFGDQTQWSYFTGGTLFDEWSAWVQARPGRRFSYSAPLLTETDSGASQAAKYASLAAGAFDSHFTTLGETFQSYPALRNSIVRLGWEFNGNSRAWAVPPDDPTTLANYKTGFNRAAAALKAACPTLKIEWCPNCQYDYTDESFADMYPGNAHVDYVGIGLYDYYWPGDGVVPTSFATRWAWLRDGDGGGGNGLADQVALAQANGKQLAHTEWGLWQQTGTGIEGGGDDPAFIDALADWHELHGYAYSVYNNTDSDGGHKLDDYPAAKARYLVRFGGLDEPDGAWVRSTSTGSAYPSTTFEVDAPAGTQPGDTLVALHWMDEGGTLAAMTAPGWALAGSHARTGYGYGKVWVRAADSSESYEFGGNESGADVAIVAVPGGATTLAVAPVWFDAPADTAAHTIPDVTAPAGGLLVGAVHSNRYGAGDPVTWSVAASGLTERADFDDTYMSQWVGTAPGPASGARTVTASRSIGYTAVALAVAAA